MAHVNISKAVSFKTSQDPFKIEAHLKCTCSQLKRNIQMFSGETLSDLVLISPQTAINYRNVLQNYFRLVLPEEQSIRVVYSLQKLLSVTFQKRPAFLATIG